MSRRTEYDESKHGINGVKTLTNDKEKGRGDVLSTVVWCLLFREVYNLEKTTWFWVTVVKNAHAALLTLFRVSLKNSYLLLPKRFSLDS